MSRFVSFWSFVFSKMAPFPCIIAAVHFDSEPGCINIDPHEYGVSHKLCSHGGGEGLGGCVRIAYRVSGRV